MSGSSDHPRLPLPTLVRLRWLAVAGELALIAATPWIDPSASSIPLPALALILVHGSSNALLSRRQVLGPRAAAAVIAFDVLALSATLALSGGVFNPFTALYLVHLATAALALPDRPAAALGALALLCYASLFLLPLSEHAGHAHGMEAHLNGMWLASAISGSFVVYTVLAARHALAQRDQELAQVRAEANRNERLAALAALAAGAAHELSTPLATIAVAARELETSLEGDEARDAGLIREQVDRCHSVLRRLAAHSGQGLGEAPRRVSARSLLSEVVEGLEPELDVVLPTLPEGLVLEVPPRTLASALRNLVDNGLDASDDQQPVVIEVQAEEDRLVIDFLDRGVGLRPEVLARLGEPFFTTREQEGGMGLGVFFSREVIRRLGGQLSWEGRPGGGTRTRVILPRIMG